ncbi:hypothetical protein VTK73DRAFT_6010 [Phialemonium thermophilum]|uniref:Uncharacterized protein n=1 Tax=Phialemonium thermophilum TaxID=223376 RepID=A0ABR3V0D5_9PEZI
MTRPKVLLLGEIAHARQAWDSLSPLADLVTPGVDNRAAFLQRCREGGFDGVVAIYRTYYSAAVTGRIDDELVGALPRTVRFISHTGESSKHIYDLCPCRQVTKRYYSFALTLSRGRIRPD